MTMKVDLSTILPCTIEHAVAHVMTTRLLFYVSRPIVMFAPMDSAGFPDVWKPGTYWVTLTLFGVLPFGTHAIEISRPALVNRFALRDAGHSAVIPMWHHLITIEPAENGVRYRDQVDIRAGVLTPLIWAFTQVFYRHRQRRWRKLVANGFDYGAA